MKSLKLIFLVIAGTFIFTSAASQNALINILTQNSGMVKKGKTVFLEVTVNNTDPASFINIFKIQVKVSVPSAIASIPTIGHILPTGWTITHNDGSTITLSNGKDMIAATDARTILIAIEGVKPGGPSTIIGTLSFSNGKSPGTEPGTLPGDNTGDNNSTSTIKVVR